ncbi:MAG: gamma-glutamylcyclotransferase family protein [Paracoccaceae bacterium]
MKNPYFFGYGSLVNRATHEYPDAAPAKVQGWRRQWRHTGLRSVAFLTVVADHGSMIEGLIAGVPNADWAALDKREWAYQRLNANDHIRHDLNHDPEVALYAVPNDPDLEVSVKHPILLSYIDVVVQGYLIEFGHDGARRFFETTDGWDLPIINDRAEPMYPRHQLLSRSERQFVDEQLSALPAKIEQGEDSGLTLNRF